MACHGQYSIDSPCAGTEIVGAIEIIVIEIFYMFFVDTIGLLIRLRCNVENSAVIFVFDHGSRCF